MADSSLQFWLLQDEPGVYSVLNKGQRSSVMPVSPERFQHIVRMALHLP